MTKYEATKVAIDFTFGEIKRTTDKSLVGFWHGVLASLQDLLSGQHEEHDALPFICYQTLKDTPVGESFREAWGADIGRQGMELHRIVNSLEDGLNQ